MLGVPTSSSTHTCIPDFNHPWSPLKLLLFTIIFWLQTPLQQGIVPYYLHVYAYLFCLLLQATHSTSFATKKITQSVCSLIIKMFHPRQHPGEISVHLPPVQSCPSYTVVTGAAHTTPAVAWPHFIKLYDSLHTLVFYGHVSGVKYTDVKENSCLLCMLDPSNDFHGMSHYFVSCQLVKITCSSACGSLQ